jgi:hypothetical protein
MGGIDMQKRELEGVIWCCGNRIDGTPVYEFEGKVMTSAPSDRAFDVTDLLNSIGLKPDHGQKISIVLELR